MSKQTKITRSAQGEDCQIRIGGVCNFNPETTVFCHLSGGGIGRKVSNLHGSYGCSSCHSAIDGHIKNEHSKEELKLWHLEGVIRTQIILLEKGLIQLIQR